MKQKTLVIAKNFQTFCIFLAATHKDRGDFVYISEPQDLYGYDRGCPLLKIEGYNKMKFPDHSFYMQRMRNQSDWSFESLKPKEPTP